MLCKKLMIDVVITVHLDELSYANRFICHKVGRLLSLMRCVLIEQEFE